MARASGDWKWIAGRKQPNPSLRVRLEADYSTEGLIDVFTQWSGQRPIQLVLWRCR